jgi:predicted RND superfamily exporter protein
MIRRPVVTLVVALLLAAASLLAVLQLRIDTSLTSLFDREDPAAAALDRVLNHFKAVEELLIFAQTDDAQPEKLASFARRFEAAIAADADASQMSEGVAWRADEHYRRFAEQVLVPNGLFYLDDAGFAAAKQRLTLDEMRKQVRRNETLIATPGPAADALAKVILRDPLRLHEFMLARFTAGRAFRTFQNGDAFIAPDGRSILIRVRGRRPVSDLEFSKRFTQTIGEIAARANTDGFRVDLSGAYAIAAASERAIRADMTSNVVWSVVCLQVLFLLAFRRPIRSFLLAFTPVAVGLLYGFGAYAILSDTLTPMTAVIGGTLAGMAIDYAIEFVTYYQAKRAGTPDAEAREVAATARRGCRGAMLAAWATSVVGFVAIGVSHVKALRDFALLGSLGLTGAFFAALLILPALVAVVDRRSRTATAHVRIPTNAMLRGVVRRPRAGMIAIAAALAVAIVVLCWPGDRMPLERDLTVMHPRPNAALDAQARIGHAFGTSPGTFIVHLTATDDAELLRTAHEVDGRLHEEASRRAGVSATFGLASVLPDPSVAARRLAETGDAAAARVIADFRAAVDDSLFDAKAYESYEQFLRTLLTATRPPGIEELRRFPTLANSLLPSPDAKPRATNDTPREAITLVFVKDSDETRESRDAVVAAVRSALADVPGATLTGIGVLGHDTELAVRRELPRVLIVSGVVVMLYMMLHYRNLTDCLLATLPAVFGIVCLLAYMRVAGHRLNMINLVAFPLLIGIDVDYGIFLVSAARREGGMRGLSVEQMVERLTPSASAVILCASATFIGFGTLIFTSIPAVRSLGAAVGVGVLTCAAATFLFVTPALVWLNRRRETTSP